MRQKVTFAGLSEYFPHHQCLSFAVLGREAAVLAGSLARSLSPIPCLYCGTVKHFDVMWICLPALLQLMRSSRAWVATNRHIVQRNAKQLGSNARLETASNFQWLR